MVMYWWWDEPGRVEVVYGSVWNEGGGTIPGGWCKAGQYILEEVHCCNNNSFCIVA